MIMERHTNIPTKSKLLADITAAADRVERWQKTHIYETNAISQASGMLRQLAAYLTAGKLCIKEDDFSRDKIVTLEKPMDWRTPTTYLQRFGDAMQALCQDQRPSDEILAAWCDAESDDHRLQEFAVEYGFYWAQGIGLIDAAHVAARQPTEGVAHESRRN